jgi:hypothetical protein
MTLLPPSTERPPVLRFGRGLAGVHRRRIRLVGHPGEIHGAVEDDFHHFEVVVQHDGERVTAVDGTARRTPWQSCPLATAQIGALVGQPIGSAIHRRKDLPDALQQCTHVFDLTVLAIAHAARGGTRQYDITIPDRIGRTRFPELRAEGIYRPPGGPDGTTRAELRRDGELVLAWDLDGETFTGPAPYTGLTARTVGRWATEHLSDDDALEAVRVLRRGMLVSGGRVVPMDSLTDSTRNHGAVGACYTLQSERLALTIRNHGSSFDFTDDPDALLADFEGGTPR